MIASVIWANPVFSGECAVQINLDRVSRISIIRPVPARLASSETGVAIHDSRDWMARMIQGDSSGRSFKDALFTGFDGRLAATSASYQRKLPHAGPSIRRRWFHEFQNCFHNG